MLTKTQLDIIGYLLAREEPQNIRGIARDLKKSYTLVYNNIEDLRKKGIIHKQDVPPAQIISIHEHAPITYLMAAENNIKEKFLQKHKWMRVFVKDVLSFTKDVFFILIIFGGYAKNNVTPRSDLDILAIVPSKNKIQEIEQAVKKPYTKIPKQVIVVDQKDFKSMLAKPKEFNVGNESRKNHIILYGIEHYYQLLQ